MKCGKLTAKLRDAVPVRFYENGKEIKRYKNIEIPDAIKELEYRDFRFDVPQNGPITFKIFFAPGTLPETWPEARQRKTRTPKDTEATSDSTGEAMAEDTAQDAAEMPQDAIEPQAEEMPQDATEDAGNAPDAASGNEAENEPLPETMTVHYNVEGSARKALAHAIGEHIGKYPAYQAAPTFAYTIGEYTLDRHGILIGPHSDYLLGCLAEDGYETK